ncbi:MAG: hypothetical protein ACK4HL_08265, partial [Aestuariivirga sp.]
MKPGIPWSVKGIEPEVREVAKDAARRAGMTLGEWLNSVILEQNEQADARPQHAPAPVERFTGREASPERHEASPPPAARRDENTLRLQDIARQLADLAQRERESAAVQSFEPPRPAGEDEEVLSRIIERIEENERQTVEAFTAVNERLSVLGQQMALVPRQQMPGRPEDVPGYPALETAIRNVVEHLEVSEKRTRDQIRAMQDRLGEVAERSARPSDPEELLRAAPAFTTLETRIADLASRMARSENLLHSGMPEPVRRELGELGARIDGVRESTEKMVREAQSAALGEARSELRDIESRILDILKEAQTTIGSQSSAIADLGRMRADLGGLGRRIEEVKGAAASQHDLHALRVALEQLSTRVAQGPDMRPLADMDRRIGELSRRIEQTTAAARELPQFGEIERRIAEIDHRLGEAIRLKGDGESIAALEHTMAALGERVGRTEEQLQHLETMERAIRQLYDGLEQSRATSRETAEEAANRAVERMLAAQGEAAPSPELKALEEGLRAVRESAASADERNQETLQAVHETLAQIVQRLAEFDAQPAQPQDTAHEQPVSAVLPKPPAEPEKTNAFASLTPEQVQAGFEAAASAAAAVPEAASAASAPLSAGDDFIAAARRAAQAAASRPSALRAEYTAVQEPAKPKRSFSLPFLRKKSKPAEPILAGDLPPPAPAEAPKAVKAANENRARRRQLVLLGIVLLAAASAFAFNMLAKPGKLPGQTSGVEEPAAPSAQQGSALGLEAPGRIGLMDVPTDSRITGSLPARKTDASLSSIVAEPSAARAEMPPPDVGTQALREAAARGDAKAQFIIASRYLDGQGVAQDLTKAAYWYQQSASRGLAPAQYRLGTLFDRGKGVPQDAAAAQLWYERAAAGGNVKSMHNAAVIAAGTLLGTPNYDKAFRLFKEAAEYGLHDSQFNLAVLYERGLGTGIDAAEAWLWYSLAAQQGDGDAAKRADTLARTLPPDELKRLKAKVAAWGPKNNAKATNVVAVPNPSLQPATENATPPPLPPEP